ncbi:MAG: hypothetical protein IJW46_01570 [Clostridia bacterium]|nr:hypothetical protein [Clostridia bacterium]
MKQETPPQKREKIFRILIALIALAALFTAFTYMLYEIISDTNRTQRLLLKAFLANEKEVFSTTPAESDPITTEKTPAEEEVLYRTSVAVDLSDHTTVIQNSTSYAVDAEALEAYVFPKHLFDTKPMILIYHSDPSEAYWQE